MSKYQLGFLALASGKAERSPLGVANCHAGCCQGIW